MPSLEKELHELLQSPKVNEFRQLLEDPEMIKLFDKIQQLKGLETREFTFICPHCNKAITVTLGISGF